MLLIDPLSPVASDKKAIQSNTNKNAKQLPVAPYTAANAFLDLTNGSTLTLDTRNSLLLSVLDLSSNVISYFSDKLLFLNYFLTFLLNQPGCKWACVFAFHSMHINTFKRFFNSLILKINY